MGLGKIYDNFDRSLGTQLSELRICFPHITKAYFAKVELLPIFERTALTYTVKRGDSLSRIASTQGTTISQIKNDNHLSGNTIHPDQVLIISKNEVSGHTMSIVPVQTASVGSRIFVVVETRNFRNRVLKMAIKQGVENVVANVDQSIAVHVNDSSTTAIEIEIGKYAAETVAQNKEDFADYAIQEITLKPGGATLLKSWNAAITESSDKNAKLYLVVDAHTDNAGIAQYLFTYYGRNVGTHSVANRWLDMDGKWFKLTESVVPWIATLYEEEGVRETVGASANPRILEYFQASGYWGTDDSGEDNAWCGSFAAWVMTQHGYTPPTASYRAKSWKNFGKQIARPVYGAIGVKSREGGGGHVSFIIGKSRDGRTYYMLGGNQGDKIQVRDYEDSVWTHFMIPEDWDEDAMPEVPLYTLAADSGSSET